VSDPVQLTDGVVRLGTHYVNWYLVADGDGVTVVDTAVRGYRGQLEPGLELLGRRAEDVRAVLLTHGDADHTGLAGPIHAATGAPIYLHADDEVMVRRPRPKKTEVGFLGSMGHPGLWRIATHLARNRVLPLPKLTETVRIADGDAIGVPGRPRALRTPGHTPGHVILHFADHGTVFTGDALCTLNVITGERGPRLMPRPFNVSTAVARQSLDRVDEVDATLVLPGHGEPWTGGAARAAALAREAEAD
jgi:glyoxylase-like metal-dependent hydrolase (beta-lactamase superfamily II)